MENPNLIQRIIAAYSKKINNWEVRFDDLLAFINNLVINDESGRYNMFSTNTHDVLTAMLMDLEEAGKIGLSYSGTEIASIKNYDYISQAVKTAYEVMEVNSEYPFPTVSSIGIKIPDDYIISLHMPENFSTAMDDKAEGKIFKLHVSGELSPVISEGGILGRRVLVLAVNKVRNYLAHKNNANYMYQKMVPICKKNTRALVDTIKMVQSNPGRAAIAIKKPDEFIFTFWTQLSSIIRNELAGKENKTGHDEGLLQSAYLINAYILYYKNIIIGNKRRDEALKYVGEKLKKDPYYFTISDIYGFSDKSGTLLDKKYKKEDLHEFINSKLQLKTNDFLPELIKVKTVNNKLYYIHRTAFLTLIHKKIGLAHDFYRKHYIDKWSADMRHYKSPDEMKSDEAFDSDLEKQIRKEDPLLYAILAYELLYLAIKDSKNIKLKAVAQGWIDPKAQAARPLPVILGLRRRELAGEVRSIVPFWLTIGFFRKLAAIFGGKKRKNKKPASGLHHSQSSAAGIPRSTVASGGIATANKTVAVSGEKNVPAGRNRAVEYRKSVEMLKNQFSFSTANIYDSLDELINDWNPLLDTNARGNLVKDVNNMVRDYMRKILRETAFAVPDPERVNNIAELLAGNKAFNVIKKRESFKKYITMYILKTLTETKP